MSMDSYPYVVFLPTQQKNRILSAIFGSKTAVSILKFSLDQGVSNKLYQRELVKKLNYSNKTIIENLKLLTKLGILNESMEKTEELRRATWIKVYQLSDVGMWFALLLTEEEDLSQAEKAEVLQKIFRKYIEWVKKLSKDLGVTKETLMEIFEEEMK